MSEIFREILIIVGFLYAFKTIMGMISVLIIKPVEKILSNKKIFKELSENRCKVHVWNITENTLFADYGANFCSDCGIVSGADPEVFIMKKEIDSILLVRKNYKELLAYKDKQKEELSNKHNLAGSIIDDIYEAGVNVKKEHQLKKIDEYLQKAKDEK